MKYSKPPTDPNDIFRLIARTPSGRQVLARFLVKYRAGQVRLEAYGAGILAKLRAALGPGQPVGACFVNDGQTGVIHYDPSAPVGILAPFLVHEMEHALDPALWSAGRQARDQNRLARDNLMLAAEIRAFDRQHRFVQELRAVDPDYSSFLEYQQARVRILNERLTREGIAELYGFKH